MTVAFEDPDSMIWNIHILMKAPNLSFHNSFESVLVANRIHLVLVGVNLQIVAQKGHDSLDFLEFGAPFVDFGFDLHVVEFRHVWNIVVTFGFLEFSTDIQV